MTTAPPIDSSGVTGARAEGEAQTTTELERSTNAWLLFPLVGLGFTLVGLALTIAGDERATYLVAGGLALLAVCPPLAIRRHRKLSMWSVILFDVAIGYTLRLMYVYLNTPSDIYIDQVYLRGRSPGYFLIPNLLAVVSFLLISLGFLAIDSLRSRVRARAWGLNYFPEKKVRQLSVLFAIVALIATALFVRGMGGIDLNALAIKRVDLPKLEGSNLGLRSLGELRWLSSLSLVGYLLLLISFLGKTPRLTAPKRAILLAYLLLVVAVPFYSSARGDALTPIVASAIVFYRTGRRLEWKRIIVLTVVGVVMLQTMTTLRHGGGFSTFIQSMAPRNLLAVPDTLILTRSFADFSKTAHVIRMTPEQLPWDNGRSIYVFAVAPIPRSIWPEKPLINSGPLIGQKIYGLPTRLDGSVTAGIPAGAQAELYWGFGLIGLLCGSVLIGTLLGFVERRYGRQADRRHQAGLLMYSAAGLLLGDGLFAGGIGYTALRFVLLTAVVNVVVRFCRSDRHELPSRVDSRGHGSALNVNGRVISTTPLG